MKKLIVSLVALDVRNVDRFEVLKTEQLNAFNANLVGHYYIIEVVLCVV
jgi:hypothetical protein